MADPNFPKFSTFPSIVEPERILLSWVGKDRHNNESSRERYKYFLSFCRYSCTIPFCDQLEQNFWKFYKQALVDTDAMKLMEGGENFEWFQIASPLFAIDVPSDGHNLFHSVCTAMWGVKDNQHIVQELMEKFIPDLADNLYTRWRHHNQSIKHAQYQWSKVISKLEGKSQSSGRNIFHSVALFVLANVIMRPIIVIDLSGYAAVSQSDSSDEMQGIYLPLERPSSDCCKSPIILCYREHRFSPLMLKSTPNKEALFPLSKGDFSVLPVRYTDDHESVNGVLWEYLTVKEIEFLRQNGSTVLLQCSLVSVTPLPEHLNSINFHLRKCQELYQDFLIAERQCKEKHNLHSPHVQSLHTTHPFNYIDESNQTYVVPIAGNKNKDSDLSSSSSLSQSMMPAFPNNNVVSGMNQQMLTFQMNQQRPRMEISPQASSTADIVWGTQMAKSKFQNVSEENKCMAPGCFNERDPDIGQLCVTCFKQNTIDESGLELLSIHYGGNPTYIIQRTQPSRVDSDPGKTFTSQISTSNGEEFQKAYSELTSYPFLSVVNESSPQCSNHSCAPHNHPLGHESFRKTSENEIESALNQKFVNSDKKPTFHNIVYHPPMNSKPITQSNFPQNYDKYEKTQIPQSFCQIEDCKNFRQDNSELCFQCLKQKNSHTNGLVENYQKSHTEKQPLPNDTRPMVQFGQAECLSRTSDEGVIEVSATPSLPSHKYEKHRCANNVCQVMIPVSQGLCEKCQNVLLSHFQTTAHGNTNEHLKSTINDRQNEQTLSAYPSGTHSSVIASRSLSKVKQAQKVHSEKMRRNEKMSKPTFEVQHGEPRKELNRNDDLIFRNNAQKLASIDVTPSLLHPSFQTIVPISAASASKEYTPSFVEGTQPPSYTRAVDSEFQQMYVRLHKEQQKELAKCRSSMCQNFGNKRKGGYCNSCFSILSDKDKHIAIFGETFPDRT